MSVDLGVGARNATLPNDVELTFKGVSIVSASICLVRARSLCCISTSVANVAVVGVEGVLPVVLLASRNQIPGWNLNGSPSQCRYP